MRQRRTLCYYGNPILRKKAHLVETISEEVLHVIDDMEHIILASETGIGLGAPQVGVSLAIIVTCFPDPSFSDKYVRQHPRVFINPKIEKVSNVYIEDIEGSLSIPGIQGKVSRPETIKITAKNKEGVESTELFSGFNARLIMHENDYLNGVLFIDRMKKEERKKIEEALQKIKKRYNPT